MRISRQASATLTLLSIVIVVFAFQAVRQQWPQETANTKYETAPQKEKWGKIAALPNEWFYAQRAYPSTHVDPEQRLVAAEEFRAKRLAARDATKAAGDALLNWQNAGPTNIPGRITDLAVHPNDSATIYAASAGSGIFKTTDLGQTWLPIFDEVGTYSMGAIALDPNNPEIVYAGTGEINGRVQTYDGTGIYKSVDGGATWAASGLPQSYGIGRIIVDPANSDRIFVAAMGRLWGTNPERGLYRSLDGGDSWEQVLSISNSTGCADIAIHPATGTLLATMWERTWSLESTYTVSEAMVGPNSGMYRSTDNGDTWQLLSDSPLPTGTNIGRIGVTIDPESQTAYAWYWSYPAGQDGIFRTDDLGDSWIRVNDGVGQSAVTYRGYYFGQIRVAPGDPESLFILGVPMFASSNGGQTWKQIGDGTLGGGIHPDHHAMYISPTTNRFIINGNDGGVAISSDGGSNWTPLHNFPNTQFYTVHIDPHNPDRLYGGAQDNGTLRTPDGSLTDWELVFGGDGFQCMVDPVNQNIIYVEAQFGYLAKSTNSGHNFSLALNGINQNDRFCWNTPLAMDPNDHDRLYFGSQRLYRTVNGAANWFPMSGDLTDGASAPGSAVITTIGVTAATNSVIYVGTDDANVWVTEDGIGWTNISVGLPERWVTRITVDPDDAAIAYVTLSGYQLSDRVSHIFRTTDYGQTWTDIAGSLPDAPVNDIIIDPGNSSTLYIATDFGVYYTEDLGVNWSPLGYGMPMQPVLDLDFHQPTRQIAAATHGRSMYRLYLNCSSGADSDGDGYADGCDNCAEIANADQGDLDYDGLGDLCDPCVTDADNDIDADGYCAEADNCPQTANADQTDADADGIGDVCDECTDTDGDLAGDPGYPANTCVVDNCPDTYNPYGQSDDADGDGVGDACDICPGYDDNVDTDGDGIPDGCDGCCLGRVGDANNSGDDEPTISDISTMIDALFIGGDPAVLVCLAEADINQSGGISPTPDDITIGDISTLIDYLFITGPSLGLPDCL